MTAPLRQQARRLNAEIAGTMRMVQRVERELRDHMRELQQLIDAEELRQAAKPLIGIDHRPPVMPLARYVDDATVAAIEKAAGDAATVVAFDRPNRHFGCPAWPHCGCRDGEIHPDCPGLDKAQGGNDAGPR